MGNATRILRKRLAVAFDFDGTLAEDSYAVLISFCGMDPKTFDEQHVQPLKDNGWEEIPAKFYALVQESKRRSHHDDKITREKIESFGQQITPYDGVPEMFDRLRQTAHGLDAEIEVEFYIITSGFAEFVRATPIAHNFKAIWGCNFHFTEDGEIDFPKRIISHIEKLRYLRQLSQGIHDEDEDAPPNQVFRKIPAEDLYVPLDQVVYVGDGASGLPAFGMMAEHGGIALGIFAADSPDNWKYASQLGSDSQVSNLTPPVYTDGSELMKSLTFGVERICKQIALRELSSGE
jgi:phosphoglycolate phosphatase-like HAD superfamily hydrolase